MRAWSQGCFQNSRIWVEDLVSKINLSSPLASSIVCSKASILLLYIHCLVLLPLFMRFIVRCLFCFAVDFCPF